MNLVLLDWILKTKGSEVLKIVRKGEKTLGELARWQNHRNIYTRNTWLAVPREARARVHRKIERWGYVTTSCQTVWNYEHVWKASRLWGLSRTPRRNYFKNGLDNVILQSGNARRTWMCWNQVYNPRSPLTWTTGLLLSLQKHKVRRSSKSQRITKGISLTAFKVHKKLNHPLWMSKTSEQINRNGWWIFQAVP